MNELYFRIQDWSLDQRSDSQTMRVYFEMGITNIWWEMDATQAPLQFYTLILDPTVNSLGQKK